MEQETKGRAFPGISSAALHILAMVLMLCDHLWATVVSGNDWLTWLGRLAFPLFAFLIVEGYHHTHDFRRYLRRLLVFALLSEIPFNLMYGGGWIFPFHQNVLWTFLISLLCIRAIDGLRRRGKWYLTIPGAVVSVGLAVFAAQLAMVDYFHFGVLTVLVFYFFRGRRWWQLLGQLAGLVYINWILMGGFYVPISIFGWQVEVPQQAMAVLALIPIWLYRGRQGYHAKWFQYACYAFYPVHILILALIWLH